TTADYGTDSDAISEFSTSGELTLNQSAVGGDAGGSDGGTSGTAGNADAVMDLDFTRIDTLTPSSLAVTDQATAGGGGGGYLPNAGNSGIAYAESTINVAANLSLNVYANYYAPSGGNIYSGFFTNAGSGNTGTAIANGTISGGGNYNLTINAVGNGSNGGDVFYYADGSAGNGGNGSATATGVNDGSGNVSVTATADGGLGGFVQSGEYAGGIQLTGGSESPNISAATLYVFGGNGGNGTATSTGTGDGAGSVSVTANANGGSGGSGSQPPFEDDEAGTFGATAGGLPQNIRNMIVIVIPNDGNGGNAIATATATGLMSNNVNATANASGGLGGGSYGIGGSALADAYATGLGGSSQAFASSSGGAIISAEAFASAPVIAGAVAAHTEAFAITEGPTRVSSLANGIQAAAFISALPSNGDALAALNDSPNVNSNFDVGGDGPGPASEILGLMTLASSNMTTGSPTTYHSEADWYINLAGLTNSQQDLLVGLLGANYSGTGSVTFTIDQNGQMTTELSDASFASAGAFFNDDTLNLGAIGAGLGPDQFLSLNFLLDVTPGTNGATFDPNIIFGNTTPSSGPTESIPTTLYWNNNSGNDLWDINASANWNDVPDSINPAVYQENGISNDNVVFDDVHNSTNSYNITLNTTVQPGSVTVNNSNNNYVISGSGNIAGTTALTKQGSDSLTLDTANTYTGATTISGGTLALGASGSIADSSTINVESGATFNVSEVSGGFTLGGLATQTLEGTGNVTGSVTVGADGTLSPGDAIGTLTVSGAVTFNSGGNFVAEVTHSSGNDQLSASGSVTLGGTETITSPGTNAAALANGDNFTVIQGQVYDNFSSVTLPTLTGGLSWNTPLSINTSIMGASSTYQTNYTYGVTNSTPSFISKTGNQYTGLTASENGGRNTTVTFLGGTVTTPTSLSVQFITAPAGNTQLLSDVAAINGTNSDTYVLQMSYSVLPTNGTLSPVLAAYNPSTTTADGQSLITNTFVSAVLLNTSGTPVEYDGAYAGQDVVGDYGINTSNDTVWAVLNYSDDDFVVLERADGDWLGAGSVNAADLDDVVRGLGGSTLDPNGNPVWSKYAFDGGSSVDAADLDDVVRGLGATEITGEIAVGGGGLTFSEPSEVPEPGSLALLAIGAMGMALRREKKK
ncbi:MAG TPA: autotransporter-associated beta strand repeat-containing protein, partial [Phycisphaerae bacterium]|nr:autotransporter-associated beta strand repeat-containing protein [Phycisphaerae bacterium]